MLESKGKLEHLAGSELSDSFVSNLAFWRSILYLLTALLIFSRHKLAPIVAVVTLLSTLLFYANPYSPYETEIGLQLNFSLFSKLLATVGGALLLLGKGKIVNQDEEVRVFDRREPHDSRKKYV